jgi:pimeloyl-ACP methyl ester carboxylesterase
MHDRPALPGRLAGPVGVDAQGGEVSQPIWRAKPCWYLVTTEDRMIPPAAQRAMADRAGASVSEIAAIHAVSVSQPQVVADLIKQSAAAGG